MTPDQRLRRLPTYLGADLCDHLARPATARALIVVDTHEALWREHNLKDPVRGAKADEWLRLLVQDSPGILFCILGRDVLRWAEVDADWKPVVERHRLGALSDRDADRFLRKIPIAEPAIRTRIVQSARGLPFYLNLQVDLYERLTGDEVTLEPDQFGGDQPAILRRFLDHLSDTELLTVRLASYPQMLSEQAMSRLAGAFMGGAGHLDWAWLTRQSFISDSTNGQRFVHALMRDALQQQDEADRPDFFGAVHRLLFEDADAEAQVKAINLVNQRTESALERAVYHRLRIGADPPVLDTDQGAGPDTDGFFDWFSSRVEVFHYAARYSFLETLFRDLVGVFSERVDPDSGHILSLRNNLAVQIGEQGRYQEAEAEFRAVWEIECRAEVLGEEHPNTLTSRHNIAQQIGNQGRDQEAEAEFRAVWEIQRRPEVLGEEHPSTLRARLYLAQVIDAQGRHAEADTLIDGLEEIMRQRLDASHRWIEELQDFQQSRRRG